MGHEAVRNGWERLPNGFDVEFRNSLSVRVSDNGLGMKVPEEVLLEEVTALGKLHVYLGDWEPGERMGEHEASLHGSGGEFAEVLGRLAASSAALFVERFHKAVDEHDVDWDRLEYLKDFEAALKFCRLSGEAVDSDSSFNDYIEIMHTETHRLAQSGELPPVDPE